MDKRQAILLTPDAYGGYPEVHRYNHSANR